MKAIAGDMNPVIWQALAPHMRHLPVEPKLQQHTFTVRGIELDCRMEFEAGEPSNIDEPGCPDEYHLVHAYVKGVDVLPLLPEPLIDQLEERAKWG